MVHRLAVCSQPAPKPSRGRKKNAGVDGRVNASQTCPRLKKIITDLVFVFGPARLAHTDAGTPQR